MARTHALTQPSALFLCCLALVAWSVLAVATPAGLSADEEPPVETPKEGAGDPPSEPPPAGEVPAPKKGYPAPPPPPGTIPAEMPAETPAETPADTPGAPVTRTALATKTHSGDLAHPFGPIATPKDWNALSKAILKVCSDASKRSRAAAKQLGKDWGGEIPADARLGITMTASLKDDLASDVPAILPEGATEAVAPLRPARLRGRTVAHVADHEAMKAHARALKGIAADKKALREAGYTGMVEIRVSVTVTLSGTPSEEEVVDVESDPTCLPPNMTKYRKATRAEEDKAAQLYWFARKARDAKDRTREINLLRELLALPPNKYTSTAQRMLESRLTRRY